MKTILASIVFFFGFAAELPICLAQGLLTPPGPPQANMISLAQLKPSNPIDPAQFNFNYPYNITTPGNYHLTTNLTVTSGNAIVIAANGVTLDLNGFTISSTSSTASGSGVVLSNAQDATIVNGHIRGGVTFSGSSFSAGPGFQYGISFTGANPVNIRVSGVTVSGCTLTGIELGTEFSSVVDHCMVRVVGGEGIHAGVVENCTAFRCGSNAINSVTAANCYGLTTNTANGVYSYTAVNCYGISSSGHGIDALSVSDSYGVSTSNNGINTNTAANCSATSSSGYGLQANTATASYGSSSTSIGINALAVVACNGSSGSDSGIRTEAAVGSRGSTNSGFWGLEAGVVQSSTGWNGSSVSNHAGLRGGYVAIGCFGESTTLQCDGVSAQIANSCIGVGAAGHDVVATYKYFCGTGATTFP